VTRLQRGFLLGKFLPPHTGHVFLCDSAVDMVDEMSVLLCSTDAEPIEGELRQKWLKDLLPRCRILHMHRDIPQAPEDHPEFWPIWKSAIAEFHPEPIDRVFGSEPYVFRLAEELNATPVLLDPERSIFPISGSDVRADPGGNWSFLPGIVRPYFQKRICLLGPESSGKSTLGGILVERFRATLMPEYGRDYDAYYRQGAGWCENDFIALAETHRAIRRAMASNANPLIIEDTDAVQTAVWAEMLLGRCPQKLEDLIANTDLADLYILLSPEPNWVNDGTRYSGNQAIRDWFFDACKRHLLDTGATFVEISGTNWQARTATATTFINEWLNK
jgi:HTH-type transcriptional regulator, transcriptional repressor of NAD biosynthesis genes